MWDSIYQMYAHAQIGVTLIVMHMFLIKQSLNLYTSIVDVPVACSTCVEGNYKYASGHVHVQIRG